MTLELLHLCDSLFPIGSFAYSDGLETAAATGLIVDRDDLREWLEVCLDETFARAEGPAVSQAWRAFDEEHWDALVTLDREISVLRPSSAARRASRAMGLRLLVTWDALHPEPRLTRARALVDAGALNPALPIAFAGACCVAGVGQRASIEAFAYTRLAATVSAAMRLISIGQADAHALLAAMLTRVPATTDEVLARAHPVESFTPVMDIALMTQQYLHSRLFRS